MVRTKQTACGGSSTRPAGMQVATYGDQLEADQDIPEEEWPDLDKPPQAAEEGEASKSQVKQVKVKVVSL